MLSRQRTPRRFFGVVTALVAVALATAAPASAKLAPDRALVNEYAAIEGAHLGVTLPGGV